MSAILEKLNEVSNGKTLYPTDEPDFYHTTWERRSNGATVCTVFTYHPTTGPVATPVVWMPSFAENQDYRIHDAIRRIKDRINPNGNA